MCVCEEGGGIGTNFSAKAYWTRYKYCQCTVYLFSGSHLCKFDSLSSKLSLDITPCGHVAICTICRLKELVAMETA